MSGFGLLRPHSPLVSENSALWSLWFSELCDLRIEIVETRIMESADSLLGRFTDPCIRISASLHLILLVPTLRRRHAVRTLRVP